MDHKSNVFLFSLKSLGLIQETVHTNKFVLKLLVLTGLNIGAFWTFLETTYVFFAKCLMMEPCLCSPVWKRKRKCIFFGHFSTFFLDNFIFLKHSQVISYQIYKKFNNVNWACRKLKKHDRTENTRKKRSHVCIIWRWKGAHLCRTLVPRHQPTQQAHPCSYAKKITTKKVSHCTSVQVCGFVMCLAYTQRAGTAGYILAIPWTVYEYAVSHRSANWVRACVHVEVV